MRNQVAIVSAIRTPLGRFGGGLANQSAAALGEVVAREAVERAGLKPDQVDEIVFGSARQAGIGPNVARQISWRTGIPAEKVAFTVNKACGSGMKAIGLGAMSIMLGEHDIVLAGGVEAMSQIPYLLTGARWGYRLGNGVLVDANYWDGYDCPLCNMAMGETVDHLAQECQITREQQDTFALESHQRALDAWARGAFDAEVVPVHTQDRKGEAVIIDHDERPRPNTNLDKLGRLPTVFRPADKGGTITPGNASGITDGAAALLLMRTDLARALGIEPLATLVAFASAGIDPARMGLAPVPAVRKVLAAAGLALRDIELLELNEAFAAQVLAVERELDYDPGCRNVNGGAVALGHPTGCSGARIVVTLLHAMLQRQNEFGLAALCISGGLGMAMVVRQG